MLGCLRLVGHYVMDFRVRLHINDVLKQRDSDNAQNSGGGQEVILTL